MRPISLLCLLLVLSLSAVLAQQSLPPVYELKTDTATYVKLDSVYSQVLEDNSGKLSLRDVTGTAAEKHFVALASRKSGLDFTIRTYWFRFRIKNTLEHDALIYLGNQNDYLDMYSRLLVSGPWLHQRTGKRVPWAERDGLKASMALPLTIPKGQEMLVYQRWHVDVPLTDLDEDDLVPTFIFRDQLVKTVYVKRLESNREQRILFKTIIYGIIMLMALYYLSVFLVVRERVYLLLVAFLICLGIYNLPVSIYNYFVSGSAIFQPITRYLDYLSTILFYVFFAEFIRQFLKTRTNLPRLDRRLTRTVLALILWYTAYLTVANTGVLPLSTRSAGGVLVLVSSVLGILAIYPLFCITVVAMLVESYRSGVQGAKLLLVALCPYVLFAAWNLINLFASREVVPPYEAIEVSQNGTSEVLEGIAAVWLVVLFSGALTQRYNQMRKEIADQALERERLEKEREIERHQIIEAQKVELERQVAERTAKVLAQKEEIEAQRDNLAKTLTDLQNTQTQLIHKEKMASLGELTAGIAHEIQNPLNFVNNFAESSVDLLSELHEGPVQTMAESHREDADDLLEDLVQNLQRITHHGQRAGSIVKSMLEHSRAGTGEKTPTDLNALTEEYLRLAYQNVRLKDDSFQADLRLKLDHGLEKVPVIPQEMGRVLLNLYSNAFYAIQEKRRQQNGAFQPQLAVSTHLNNGKIEIRVKDNGTGIPKEIINKIYQPFFTTKPTGQGNTGLGLSLSYDIVTKGHNGEINVETELGEFTEFIVRLPK
ncbi:hypothetical protein GCM10023187_23950 [Nibrella viscosa]|uniref:histidine kinase n=1 Tax=Nibrella viscosa TaxID=1084524 RepID=A0ABP8KFG5_9BACT